MYAYLELVEDSAECLQDSSLVKTDIRYRDMADGEQGGVN